MADLEEISPNKKRELESATPVVEDPNQLDLFDVPKKHDEHWKGMPAYTQEDLMPWQTIKVHVASRADRDAFAKLMGQTITDDTRYLWHPKAVINKAIDKRWANSAEKVNPKWPLYIVSKGRYETRLTSDALDEMGIPHFIVVEEQERELYAARVKPTATLLTLDMRYKENYELCDELGLTKSTGPGPARNFAWEHSMANGHAWHWVMDDNIDGFYRLQNNLKTRASSGAIFRAMEDWCERYENVGMAGPNYTMFAKRRSGIPPFILNTRIYSCNLIRNDVPVRWRGRYNEDTDISLRLILGGWVTAQFNAFLQNKTTTQVLGGGNTAEFYAHEGTTPKSEMLQRMHPSLVRVITKWGRVHHHVNYRMFRFNPALKLRDGVEVQDDPNEYGMEKIQLHDGEKPLPQVETFRGMLDTEQPEEQPRTDLAL